MSLDDQIGNDSNVSPVHGAFAASLADQAKRLERHPARLQSFLAGLAYQDLLKQPGVASALAPFMRLPKPETRTHKRARMAKVISETVAATERVTRDDLVSAGFSDAEIGELFREALRASGVQRMAA